MNVDERELISMIELNFVHKRRNGPNGDEYNAIAFFVEHRIVLYFAS